MLGNMVLKSSMAWLNSSRRTCRLGLELLSSPAAEPPPPLDPPLLLLRRKRLVILQDPRFLTRPTMPRGKRWCPLQPDVPHKSSRSVSRVFFFGFWNYSSSLFHHTENNLVHWSERNPFFLFFCLLSCIQHDSMESLARSK